MSVALFTEQVWLDRIKKQAGINGVLLAGSPKLPLSFSRIAADGVCKVGYAGLPLGGVILDKIDLTALLSGIVINVASFKSTSEISQMGDVAIFNFAMEVIGLTDLTWTDTVVQHFDQELHITVAEKCVKYKGSLRVKYAY